MLDYPVGPKYNDWGLYNTRAEGGVRWTEDKALRGEGNVKTEAEVMHLHVKKHQEFLAPTRS